MDIEEQKRKFLSLLCLAYKASRVNTGFGEVDKVEGKIFLKKAVLDKYGLDDEFFWDIICPALKEEGVLISYDRFMVKYPDFLRSRPEYQLLNREREKLIDTLPSGYYIARTVHDIPDSRTPYTTSTGRSADDVWAEIKKLDLKIHETVERALLDYQHEFVVEAAKLLPNTAADLKAGHIVVTDTPEGAEWSGVRLQFTGRHSLHVSIPKLSWAKADLTPKDFGLETKGGKPKVLWTVLLALSKNEGKFPLNNLDNKKKETCRKQLTSLSSLLQDVFPNIGGGRAIQAIGNMYECAFMLVPEQTTD